MVEKTPQPKYDLSDAAALMAEEYIAGLVYDEDTDAWLRWTGTHWQDTGTSKTELDRMATLAMRSLGLSITGASKLDGTLRLAKVKMKKDLGRRDGVINFANGTLEVKTGGLSPHDPSDGLRYCLFYDYAPGPHPIIDSYLESSIPDPLARECVRAHIGLALLGDNALHYALVIQGVPRSGKSLMLALIKTMCGAATRDAAYAFAGDSLFSRDTEGKRARYTWNKGLIVCLDEAGTDALRDEDAFKSMSAHSGVEARGINKDESEATTWKPKLVIATNNTPRFKDASGAMAERILPIIMPRHRIEAERDAALLGKMREEAGAFVATCIASAQAALDRGYYRKSRGMSNVLASWASAGNGLRSFVKEYCVLEAGAKIPISQLFEEYKTRCMEADQKSLQRENMVTELRDGGMGIGRKKMRIGGLVVWGLTGIRLMTDAERASQDEDDGLDTTDYRPSDQTEVEILAEADGLAKEGRTAEARRLVMNGVHNQADRAYAIEQLDAIDHRPAPLIDPAVIASVGIADRLRHLNGRDAHE